MGKNNGRTTDKVIPGAQTRPAEADTKRESAGVNDAAGPKPGNAAPEAPVEETDQSQGGGNPHVPTPKPSEEAAKAAEEGEAKGKDAAPAAPKPDAKPTKAESDKHDRDHERVKVRVLRPIVENGLHHPVDAFFETTRLRAAALGDLVRIEK